MASKSVTDPVATEPLRARMFADAAGRVHLAMTARAWAALPTGTVRSTVLLAGRFSGGQWDLRELRHDVADADLAVAADRHGVTHVAFFGKDTFKVARLCMSPPRK